MSALPRTRSGKIIRKSIANLARSRLFKVNEFYGKLNDKSVRLLIETKLNRKNEIPIFTQHKSTLFIHLLFANVKYPFFSFQISSTIEDASVYVEIKEVLQKLGYAKLAPDPQ